MTTLIIKPDLARKIAPYILFLFTVLSFFFTNPFFLSLFISLATLGFIFVNTTQLFSRNRYVSYIEIFSSILLLIRLLLIFTQSLFYQIIVYFILFNFVFFYILHFRNVKAEDTNILGIRKDDSNYHQRKNEINESDFGEEENELENLLPDDDPLEDEDQIFEETDEEDTEKEILPKKPKPKKSKTKSPKKKK